MFMPQNGLNDHHQLWIWQRRDYLAPAFFHSIIFESLQVGLKRAQCNGANRANLQAYHRLLPGSTAMSGLCQCHTIRLSAR